MSPLIFNVNFLVGTNEDWRDVLTLYEPWEGMDLGEPPPVDATPVDLTDATFKMHLRSAANASVVALALTTANTRLGLSGTPTDGQLMFNVPDDVMSSVAPGNYVYDCLMTQGGVVRQVMSGTVEVVQGITR